MTGKKKYRDLSIVCVANMIARVWMWECDYGFAKHYTTFMGASPLHECEYVAAYEEAEAIGIAVEYLKTIGDAAPRGVRMLLAEYVKFLLHRGKYYFPENLPAKVVAASPKEGKIDRRLAIPLEDLSTGWKQGGKVGQEVYGSSVSFVSCVSAYLNYANAPIMVFCEYPILDDEGQFAPDGSGIVKLRLGGTPEFFCKVRVIPKNSMEVLPRVSVQTETWARSTSGDTAEGISWIVDGIEEFRATGALRGVPFFLALKAEALQLADRTFEALEAIREAQGLVERFEERLWRADLHRLRGVLLTAMGADETQIEASFCEAIRTAREQKSIPLARRAEASYAEYRSKKQAGQ